MWVSKEALVLLLYVFPLLFKGFKEKKVLYNPFPSINTNTNTNTNFMLYLPSTRFLNASRLSILRNAISKFFHIAVISPEI